MNFTQLATVSAILRFGSADGPRLQQELELLEQQTRIYVIDQPQQVLLRPDGRTLSGLRYTVIGLRQICAAVADSLNCLVTSLAGLPGRSQREVDVLAAIDVFNRVVGSRFSSLRGYRIVQHTDHETIDGVLSPKYQRLSHTQLYSLLVERINLAAAPLQFHEAALEGRRLVVRYRSPEPVFDVGSDPFFGGIHFSNSEVAATRVHIGTLLLRQACDNKAVGGIRNAWGIRHVGNTFWPMVEALCSEVLEQVGSVHQLKTAVQRLMTESLGLSGTNAAQDTRRCDAIVEKTRRRGLTRGRARWALTRALQDSDRWAQRTYYDLFNGLTSEAKDCPLVEQERIERAAYNLLVENFNLTKPGV